VAELLENFLKFLALSLYIQESVINFRTNKIYEKNLPNILI
jgi:hypothetical protein